jgi:PAS domain S-box-containing protein
MFKLKLKYKFRNLSIKNKITILIAIIFFAVFIVNVSYFPAHEEEQITEFIQSKAQNTMQILSSTVSLALGEQNYEYANNLFSILRIDSSIVYVGLLDESGSVINVSSAQDIKLPALNTFTSNTFFEENNILHTSGKIQIDEGIDGYLVTGFSVAERDQQISKVWLLGLWVNIGILLLTILFYLYLNRLITKPLIKFAKTIKHIAQVKDYTQVIEAKNTDEIGMLVQAFNTLNSKVYSQTEELKKHQLHLEQLVEEKTEKLKESEEHFRGLFENSTIGIYRSTPEGKSIMSNPKLLELMGFSSFEELQKANMYDIYVDLAERDKFKDLVEKNGTVYGIESAWKRPDGTRIYVQESARVVKDDNGKVLFYEGTVEDITDRKIAEEALYESEERLRTTISSMDDMLFVLDKNGIFINYHIPSNQDTYAPPEVFLGKSYREILPQYIVEQFDEAINNALKTGSVQQVIYSLNINRKLCWYDAKISLRRDNEGNYAGITAVIRDITKNKEAEEQILFQANLLSNVEDSVIATDLKGKIIYWNIGSEKILGFIEDEMLGESLLKLYPDPDPKLMQSDGINVIRGGKFTRGWKGKSKDGSMVWLDVKPSALKNINNKTIGFLLVSKDITEQKKADDAIKESERRLRELNATKDKFFSIISHDLRSPFQALLSISDFFANDIENMTKQEIIDFASNLNQSAECLYELLNNLLDWSRVQTGKMKIEPKEIHLKRAIDKVVHLLTANAHSKRISLTTKIREDLIVYADQNMLHSVVQNLVSNAIKFTKEGGEIKVISDAKGEYTEVAIADNGVGMDNTTLEKLFRLDTQVTSPGTNNEKGTGLGLILCKELIEKCGGKIWVESKLNRGTTFHFTLKKENGFHKN